VETIPPADFARRLDDFDAAVAASPDIDRFCSGSEWTLAAKDAWAPKAETWIARGEHGWTVFLRQGEPADTPVMSGFETMWGLSCPLAGPAGKPLALEFLDAVGTEPWRVLILTGLRTGSPLLDALARFARDLGAVRPGPLLRRRVASLQGGVDGFLKRRSAKFRANLRRAAKLARAAGVAFESAPNSSVAVARAAAVERRSWKGAQDTGLASPDFRAFYDSMGARLAARGRLRAIFARRDGEDVGYILGGVRDRAYRGFQFSYDARLRALSLGSLLQLEQVAELAAEGVESYDLGVDLPYKRRWGELSFETATLAIYRARPGPAL
jgi:nitroreductase